MESQKEIMKNIKTDRSKLIFFILSLVIVTGVFAADLNRDEVRAGVSHNMSGYAWGDTVGWISFNCTDTSSCNTVDYGVGINESSGNLFGYAWSPNIGWITFNQNELSGCPSSPCRARLINNALTGWGRALSSQDQESGGWDGWISLSGTNYGVTLNGSTFSGYAWGSAIVGWINFNTQYNGVTKGTLTASLTPSDINVSSGQPVTLTWTSTLATECSSNNFSTGGATSGNIVVYPNSTTNYKLTCSNDFDSVDDTKQVQVWNTECGDGIDNDLDGDIDLNDLGCTNISDDNESSVEFVVTSILATPSLVQIGDTTVISWSAEGVNSCSVTGDNGDSWTGISGSQQSSVISEQVTYTLACLDVENHTANPVTVTVSLVPIFQEF